MIVSRENFCVSVVMMLVMLSQCFHLTNLPELLQQVSAVLPITNRHRRRTEGLAHAYCHDEPGTFVAELLMMWILLLLGGELLAERCRTDDLMPSITISCIPPCCMDPKVEGSVGHASVSLFNENR